MQFWAELGSLFQQAIRQGRGLDINRLSEEIKVSSNLLYKNATYFQNGCGISPTLENTILIMDRQRDYRILKLVCRRFGYFCIKQLPYPKNNETHIERLFQLHARYVTVTGLFTGYIKTPLKETLNKIILALDDSVCYEQSLLRALRVQNGQLDLFKNDACDEYVRLD